MEREVECANCLDTGLACSAHPYQPFGLIEPEGCRCGADAMLCPTCVLDHERRELQAA